jgi:hypothetical protein
VARVHRGDEALDRAALAARVPALEDHAHRRPELAAAGLPAELQTQPQQPCLRGFEPLGLLGLGQFQ